MHHKKRSQAAMNMCFQPQKCKRAGKANRPLWFHIALSALSLALLWLHCNQGFAQAIIASVNGDPVTDLDLNQQMKLLGVLHKPADKQAALESLFIEHLKTREAVKYGVDPKDAEINQQIVISAQEMKIAPEALVAALQHSSVTPEHFKAYFKGEIAFTILVQALNKGVEASESEVRAELAKEGGKAAAGEDYSLRQIIFTLPNKLTPTIINERAHEAEQLRQRFTDCDTGVPIARTFNDVTVRDALTRSTRELSEGFRQILDKTPMGHLSAPQRSAAGLEMVALCSKKPSKDDTAVRNTISQKLLAAHIAEDSKRRIKELRDHAIIVKL
jgi:peptidyl-prolyl cis-trans isomerase SurA